MAVFVCKTIQQDENTVSFTYRFRIPGEVHECGHPVETSSLSSFSTPRSNFDRVIDPNFDFTDPIMLEHCDAILKKAEIFNDRLRDEYGIVPEEVVDDDDTRPRFLRTPDKSSESEAHLSRQESKEKDKGVIRPPYTPYPCKADRATRDAARVVVRNLANQAKQAFHPTEAGEFMPQQFERELANEANYRVTSTISSIAGKDRPFNTIRLVRSDPEVTRTSTIVSRSDILSSRATSSASSLASNLISLTHTGSSTSAPNMNARSSSAHSRLTPHYRRCPSPTLSDVVRFRNRIGLLSDFLRNPRHAPPKPVVHSCSDASTQHGGSSSSNSKENKN
ncbi:hypothetical protein DICVIV_09012 [Dictyocaulus viviparus]|uniref:Uncharacterized protein n=1 Tax=Dictyocaulus viviparus TaxID=29172 RepID=A0A0D8XRC1_DICVI|nr:hypothetical protein DICVIV_09012 [Dictyocaulus viviparus]